MAGVIPEIAACVVVPVIHQLESAPGDGDDPAHGKSRGKPEVDLNNVPLPEHDRPGGIALIKGIADAGHRVLDRDGRIDRNRDPGNSRLRIA